jgi:hypothetical protein
MANHGKVQYTSIIIAPPDQVAEGDRIFQGHERWMQQTHHRSGPKALLSYNVSKGPELTDPMNPASAPTGNTCFVLTEVYETNAGIEDHFQQAATNWREWPDVLEWLPRCRSTTVLSSRIVHSLW